MKQLCMPSFMPYVCTVFGIKGPLEVDVPEYSCERVYNPHVWGDRMPELRSVFYNGDLPGNVPVYGYLVSLAVDCHQLFDVVWNLYHHLNPDGIVEFPRERYDDIDSAQGYAKELEGAGIPINQNYSGSRIVEIPKFRLAAATIFKKLDLDIDVDSCKLFLVWGWK